MFFFVTYIYVIFLLLFLINSFKNSVCTKRYFSTQTPCNTITSTTIITYWSNVLVCVVFFGCKFTSPLLWYMQKANTNEQKNKKKHSMYFFSALIYNFFRFKLNLFSTLFFSFCTIVGELRPHLKFCFVSFFWNRFL